MMNFQGVPLSYFPTLDSTTKNSEKKEAVNGLCYGKYKKSHFYVTVLC